MGQAWNPYLPSWEYVPDGEPHVDVVEHRGKYYLYYGLDSSIAISVAVSDRPEGPYSFYGNVHHRDGQILGLKKGDAQQFDPGVFRDDDGSIYLYSGFSTTPDVAERIRKKMGEKADDFNVSTEGSWVVRLEEDMLTLKAEPQRLLPGVSNSAGTGFEGHEFFEASSMRKFNGKYYAVYSSVQGHELCYAMSDYPDRDFVYKGILHSNGNLGISDKPLYYYANNHGSLVEINGEYYVFGHRHTNYTQYQRQGVAEKLSMNSDGTFEQAEMSSCGLNGRPLRGRGEYPAYIACVLQSGNGACKADISIDRKQHPAITQDERNEAFITNLQEGAVVGFKYFDLCQLTSIRVTVKADDV